ncbi:hypothetical protein RDWZM_004444, partial [Blomia tropicalis]
MISSIKHLIGCRNNYDDDDYNNNNDNSDNREHEENDKQAEYNQIWHQCVTHTVC